MSAPFVSRALLAATFTGVHTPAVKAHGVLEIWFLYQVSRPGVIQLAVPALKRGWSVPREAIAAGMFGRVMVDGIEIAPGPRRARVLLPAPTGRVGLYTPRQPLLNSITATTELVPLRLTKRLAAEGWSR